MMQEVESAEPQSSAPVPGAVRDLPPALSSLVDLALDLRWTWSHAGDALWRSIDPETWEATRNPWFVLQNTRHERLDELAHDIAFMDSLRRLDGERHEHLRAPLRPPA